MLSNDIPTVLGSEDPHSPPDRAEPIGSERRSWFGVFRWRIVTQAVIQVSVAGTQVERMTGTDRTPISHTMTMPSMPGMPGTTVPVDEHPLSPWLRWLRSSTLSVPLMVVALLLIALILRWIVGQSAWPADGTLARVLFAIGTAVAAAVSLPLGDALAGVLFSEPLTGVGASTHYLDIALVGLRYSFALGLLLAAFFGVPWSRKLPNTTSTHSVQKELS